MHGRGLGDEISLELGNKEHDRGQGIEGPEEPGQHPGTSHDAVGGRQVEINHAHIEASHLRRESNSSNFSDGAMGSL